MIALALFCFGAIIGSFLNVMIIRHGARSITGRSECLSCATQLRWFDNIPIFSWLALRGRCRSCGSAISVQYLLVEVLTAALFVCVGLGYSASGMGVVVLACILTAFMIAIAVYDIRHTIIPDMWVYTSAGLALILGLSTHVAETWIVLLSGPTIALPLFMLWLVSRGTWMGLGDAKLALAIGWALGPLFGYVALLLSFVIGAIVSVCILLPLPHIISILQKRGIARLSGRQPSFTMRSEVAFGPFLVAAFFIAWLALLYNIPLPI